MVRDMHQKRVYRLFPRLNNRRKQIFAADLVAAGYPSLELPRSSSLAWSKLHEEATKIFNTNGERNYVWFGDTFFFQNEMDKTKFILLFC